MGLIPGSGGSPGVESGNPPSILAWRILWTEGPGGLQSVGIAELDMTGQLSTHAKHHEDSNLPGLEGKLCGYSTFPELQGYLFSPLTCRLSWSCLSGSLCSSFS